MPNNIIDSIRLSGTTYQIQGSGGGITVDPTLDSGSTNPVANSAITTALDDKVNVADNNASAYTFVNKISGVEYGYSEHFAGPIYIRYTGSTSSSGDYYAGSISYYTNEWGWENIGLDFNLSNGQITATTVSSNYFDVEIENGEAALTFKDGYYLRQYNSQNEFVVLTKTAYESGQSADVIEDTVYDVFDKLNDKIDKTSANAVTGGSIYFSNGYLDLDIRSKNTTSSSSVKIDSSTIKSSNNGLSVQFETSEVGDKILNVGSGSYGQLFSTDSYDTSLNEFTITFNQNCTQYGVYYFSVRIIDASAAMTDTFFEYDSSDMSAVYTYLKTYCTVTDTLPTDYKLKVTAKEGYKIARLRNDNYMVGGVDNRNPNNYISNLVTAPSYVHDGQDVIDDIYDKLDDKQDTLVSGTNIKTVNNQSLLGSGNIDIQSGGGKAVTGGTNISVVSGETADTINCTLPFSYEGDNLKTTVSGNSFVNYSHYEQIFGINNTLQGKNDDGSYGRESGSTIIGNGNQMLRNKDSIVIGSSNNLGNIFGQNKQNYVFGYSNTLNPGGTSDNIINNNFVIGNNNVINKKNNNFIFGYGIKPSNDDEFALGKYNNSVSASTTFGDSGNTLFSVGNGTSTSARHNAFEIRQNGDIYCSDGTNDVKLQDTITATAANTTALGGLSLVKLTQSAYDALSPNYDSNTLYIVTDS